MIKVFCDKCGVDATGEVNIVTITLNDGYYEYDLCDDCFGKLDTFVRNEEVEK